MPAEVESMMYVNEPPWHGLGKRVPSEVTSEEAIVLSGLDWDVELRDIFTTDENGNLTINVKGRKAVVRTSDNSVLGDVGSRYQPIQNRKAFQFFDGIVGSGKAIYHTAGSLQDGKRVWILAKLPGEIVVGKGDVTQKFLLLSSSHDGSSPLEMMFTPIRVVCQNTLNLALHERNSSRIRVSHTTSFEKKMEAAEKAVQAATEFYDSFNEHVLLLSGKKYDVAKMRDLVVELFPNTAQDKVTKNIEEKRACIVNLFENGAGHDAIAGSAWAAMNAVAEYTDHHMNMRKVNSNNRTFNAWYGQGQEIKNRAHDIIVRQLGL